jgi:hypothetical protein
LRNIVDFLRFFPQSKAFSQVSLTKQFSEMVELGNMTNQLVPRAIKPRRKRLTVV